MRLAVIGGGPGAWIGDMHRGGAAQLDGHWRMVAGVFSNDPERSRAAGISIGLETERAYGDVANMLKHQRARYDAIDAVAVLTPNDTHDPYAGWRLSPGWT